MVPCDSVLSAACSLFAGVRGRLELGRAGGGGAVYFARVFGLTAFYHRYFSHRAFKTSRIVQFLGACWETPPDNAGRSGGRPSPPSSPGVGQANDIHSPRPTRLHLEPHAVVHDARGLRNGPSQGQGLAEISRTAVSRTLRFPRPSAAALYPCSGWAKSIQSVWPESGTSGSADAGLGFHDLHDHAVPRHLRDQLAGPHLRKRDATKRTTTAATIFGWPDHVRRRMAQQPSLLSVVGTARFSLVGDRHLVLPAGRHVLVWAGVGLEASSCART